MSWIIHLFHGVATKYLDHYLWWKYILEDRVIKDFNLISNNNYIITNLTGT